MLARRVTDGPRLSQYRDCRGFAQEVLMTDDETRPCACEAKRHGPAGCQEPAPLHPEGSDLDNVCGSCGPYEATGRHSDEFPRQAARMTRDELEEMVSDRELIADEFHGWAPGEIMEAYGK